MNRLHIHRRSDWDHELPGTAHNMRWDRLVNSQDVADNLLLDRVRSIFECHSGGSSGAIRPHRRRIDRRDPNARRDWVPVDDHGALQGERDRGMRRNRG